MTGPLRFLRRLSLRVRITVSYVATVAALATTISVVTFVSVRTALESSRTTSATRQTIFAVLFAREFLSANPERPQQLVSLLQTRERFDAMVVRGDEWFSTTLSLTPDAIPRGVRGLVEAERLGYQEAPLDGHRSLVFGAPLPPPDTDLYLVYPLEEVDATLGLLARTLALTGGAVILVAALLAQRVSRRVLRPLSRVSRAARQVAEGLLETRVEASSRDEAGVLAASFNRMAEALQEMIERERRFVAAVSHELRSPLAALQATAEVLWRQRDDLGPNTREAVELIVEDVRGLRRLIEELMEVSELDAGRAVVRTERLDLGELARATVRKRQADVPVVGAGVECFADKARVERIVGNLLDNALEHGEGTDVRVTVRRVDGHCEIQVSDRGPGVRPEDVGHLFERFYKADRSRTRERGGIGLGLAIAMANAKLLGGTIEVSGEPGGGATFVLRLPAAGDGDDGTDREEAAG